MKTAILFLLLLSAFASAADRIPVAGDFAYKFAKNEIAADAAFKGKRVTVLGIVESVSRVDGRACLFFERNYSWTARCFFVDAADLVKVQPGQLATLSGVVKGVSVKTNVDLDDCQLISVKEAGK